MRVGIRKVGVFLTGLRQETRRECIAHLHSRFTQAGSCGWNSDAQYPCGFRCREILDVLQEEHFPICYGKGVNRTPQRVTQFFSIESRPSDFAPVRQRISLAARMRLLGRRRSEDLFKTGCRNRKCFCAHTY